MLKRIFTAFLSAAVFSVYVPNYGFVFENMGHLPEKECCEAVEITIPHDWGAVYENYNSLQKRGGFDLAPYKGKKCIRYTYELTDIGARGNVLVYKGQVIGGDICSITLDGIMLPIEKDKLK